MKLDSEKLMLLWDVIKEEFTHTNATNLVYETKNYLVKDWQILELWIRK